MLNSPPLTCANMRRFALIFSAYHKRHRQAYPLVMILCLYSPVSWGYQEFKNIREECRSNLAGIFINIYSALDDTTSRNNSVMLQAAEMQKDLKLTEEKFKKLRLEIDKKDYNPELQDQRITYTSQIGHIKNLIAEYDVMTTKNSKDIGSLKTIKEILEKSLGKVFDLKVTKLGDSPRHGKYSIQLEYKHSCNKFYAICPLPARHVESLNEIVRLIKTQYADQLLQPACERYAQVIAPPK